MSRAVVYPAQGASSSVTNAASGQLLIVYPLINVGRTAIIDVSEMEFEVQV